MSFAIGVLLLATTIALLVIHVLLLVHVGKTRGLAVLAAALFIPPVAPLTCASGGKQNVARGWFMLVAFYAVLLVIARYVR